MAMICWRRTKLNINEILDFIATTSLNGSWLVEDLRGHSWTKAYGEISWRIDDEAYSSDGVRGTVQLDGLVFINADSGQGYKLTYVFSKDKFEGMDI